MYIKYTLYIHYTYIYMYTYICTDSTATIFPSFPAGAGVWGLATMLATAVLNPGLGAWADQTDRCKVVTLGVLAQVGKSRGERCR